MLLNSIIFSIAITALCSLPAVSFSQENACVLMSGDQACDLKIEGSIYHIENRGLLTVKRDGKSLKVDLNVPDHFYIDEVRSQIQDDNILFILGITGDDSAGAMIVHFDPMHYRILWSTAIRAFNISPLLISGNFLYIGGIGTVAKLRLTDGKILWQHADLYESKTNSYNAFILPRKDGNIIIFKEYTTSKKKTIREVHVDDTTGNILSK